MFDTVKQKMDLIVYSMIIVVLVYSILMMYLTLKHEIESRDIPLIMFYVLNIIACTVFIVKFNKTRACYYLIVKGGIFLILTPLMLLPMKDIFNPMSQNKIKTMVVSYVFYFIFTLVSVGYCSRLIKS